jgi:site-specific DNA-methyltransferase (adenine-specific)
MRERATKITFLGQQDLPISDLKPHPDNPNRGSVPHIAESLREFGQYRGIVATKDGTILAGHHVVEAAKGVGMDTIRVDIIDTDETTAKKILLADNRLADLGLGPDLGLLLRDLEELAGDLTGTGYDQEYIKLLEDAVIGPPETQKDPPSDSGMRHISLNVDEDLALQWDAHRKLFTDDNSALGYLLGG